MRVLISITFLIVCYFLSACQHTASEAGYQAIGKYSKKANKQWGWELCGVGGQFGDAIAKFNLDYETYKFVDVNEARYQLIAGVEKFLQHINDNDRISSFLIEKPFSQKRLKFGLSFCQPTGLFVEPENIAYALLLDGYISYSINSPTRLIHVHEETYEEALAIVRNEEARATSEPGTQSTF